MAVVINEAAALERAKEAVPPLEQGDRLTRIEFERRYEAMRNLKKAEAHRRQGLCAVTGETSARAPTRKDNRLARSV